ncbi:DUF4926 domain-containing protein [Larkinella sp. VNQ87]|uniref:DUF4926 domain-containing protein n=1 Tax=Larkinella sp. VNQ87 TaxID=3400921 RepID=UPI003C069146
MDELHLHDLVALTAPLPEHKMRRGEIGVIVDKGTHSKEIAFISVICINHPALIRIPYDAHHHD